MTENIAIFDKEEGVLDAIRMLREAGAERDDIRVIVNNREGAPLLTFEGDIRMEELYELQLTRNHDEDNGDGISAFNNAVIPPGISATGSGPVSVVLADEFEGEKPGSAELLQEMGIPDIATKRCAKAIENGRYVVVTDTEAGINAAALLSRAGAADVIECGDE